MNAQKLQTRRGATLPTRKLSVQSRMLGGQTMKEMMIAKHAEEEPESTPQAATARGTAPKQTPSHKKGTTTYATPFSRSSK